MKQVFPHKGLPFKTACEVDHGTVESSFDTNSLVEKRKDAHFLGFDTFLLRGSNWPCAKKGSKLALIVS